MTTVPAEPTLQTMMRHLRLLALAPFVLGLVFAGAGCGGGNEATGTSLPVLEDFEPVAAATAKADTARFEMQLSMQVPGIDEPFAFTATGASDEKAGRGEITMDLGSFAESIIAFGQAFGSDAPEGFDDPENWNLEMRLDGTVAYMRMPFFSGELPAGKEWVRLDLAKAAAREGFDFAQLPGFAEGSDPRELLDFLRAVSSEVTLVGTENVRGVETTHYFAVVDLEKALADLARKSGDSSFLAQFQSVSAKLQNVPLDVWVDADYLVRRMVMDLSVSVPGESGQVKASVSMELFDYGKPVSVEVPPASDVVDLSALQD